MSTNNNGNSFAFISVGEPSAKAKRRNANQARSHAMIQVRRRQRLSRDQTKPREDEPNRSDIASGSLEASLPESEKAEMAFLMKHPDGERARCLLQPFDYELANAAWGFMLRKNIVSEALSNASLLERDINALQGYTGRVTMHLHRLITHVTQTIWPKFWPAKKGGDVSPLVVEWWPLFLNVPAVFHAFLYAAAVHHDDLRGETELSTTREILEHKSEALREIQKALTAFHPKDLDDSYVLAMTYLGMVSEDNERHRRHRHARDDALHLLKPPLIFCSIQWTRHYAYAKENVHVTAASRLADAKGGLDQLTWSLAKSLAINDIQISSKHIVKPHFPFWEIPDILAMMEDPNVNAVPDCRRDPHRASAFKSLLSQGLTDEALRLLQQESKIAHTIEVYHTPDLINPDYQSILCEKNQIQHRLLSLPSACELGLAGCDRDIYECCRIGGLMFSTAVLYPLPPSTGAPARLVAMAKRAVENMGLETCMQGGAMVLIWLLVLAGMMAQNTSERPWLLQRLKPVLAIEGIKSWEELKPLLTGFLWMDSACDEAAIGLFEELRLPSYL